MDEILPRIGCAECTLKHLSAAAESLREWGARQVPPGADPVHMTAIARARILFAESAIPDYAHHLYLAVGVLAEEENRLIEAGDLQRHEHVRSYRQAWGDPKAHPQKVPAISNALGHVYEAAAEVPANDPELKESLRALYTTLAVAVRDRGSLVFGKLCASALKLADVVRSRYELNPSGVR